MRKLSLIVPLSILIVMTVLLVILAIPTPKDKLEKAVAGADRIVVVWQKGPGTPSKDVFTLTEESQIARFLECLDFEKMSNVETRAFFDSYYFQIFKGEELLASLMCDPTRMKWDGGNWEGCAILTQTSRAALLEWLKENGWEIPTEQE